MKTLIVTTAFLGLALGSLSPALAGDAKKCGEGLEWDKTTKQCVKKKS